MINLIHSSPPAAEIASILRANRRRDLLPAMDAPEWKAAAAKPAVQGWMKGIRALAEKEALEPLPPLTDELYGWFFKTGERLPFERIYFERRRMLARAAMVVLLGDAETRRKFIPTLMARIEGIMAEVSWTFPAHVWTNPTGKDPLMIDLFAAETANLMGELISLFGEIIPKDLSQRIRERLHVQMVENYLKRHREFTWTGLPMNWNAVCHQGVLGSALAVEDEEELLGQMLATAGPCLRLFLAGFGEDGSTSEGPGYWSYGFGRFAELNRQLETATNGALSFFGDDEQVRRIAAFAPALAFSNGYLVNFSDGQRAGRLPAELIGYLGQRLALPALVEDSAATFRHTEETGFDLQGQRCDLYFMTRLFLHCPASTAGATGAVWPDIYFPDYGAVVSRGRDNHGNLWEFAAKGGHNDEHHNHNDCGTYVLNFNGHPAIIEIGAPEYVHGYFGSEQRYTFLAARSLGHSVPLVNGCEQVSGRPSSASVIRCAMTKEGVDFALDLTKCYPAQARCRKLIRTFTFLKSEGVIRIVDDFELEGEGTVESMVIGEAPMNIDGEAIRIDAAGGAVRITPGKETAVSKIEVCDYSSHTGKPSRVNRLRLSRAEAARCGAVGYEIRPG
ncbi:MAG TPA: heparinase II/III family protein [Candidatus Methylacidiphilales bacterium]